MENTTTQNNAPTNPVVQQTLPNSTAVLILGILSIAICWCYGLVGITMGIIALVLSSKAKALYAGNPDQYTIGSYKNMNAGRICAIIGTVLSSLYIVVIIIYLLIVGTALSTIFTQMPWETF
ncbi:MAG TPA: CCC motif membrane protein [Bacteroidales bacterium]|nr:CCC motif membrane protein [Bacteroidales bacterium]